METNISFIKVKKLAKEKKTTYLVIVKISSKPLVANVLKDRSK